MSKESSYLPVTSNCQIVTLLKRQPHWVTNIFSKTLYSYFTEREIDTILREVEKEDDLNDKKIYDRFREKIKEKPAPTSTVDLANRGKGRAKDVMGFFNKGTFKKGDRYLDLGGGNGTVSFAVGTELGLEEENIICADINTWFDDPDRTQKVTYVILDEDKDLPDGKDEEFEHDGEFQLITCFQSLHHMKNVNGRLISCRRINKKGGAIVIREHDCINDDMRMLIDIEHCIFELVLKEYNQKFVDSYFADYKSKQQWHDIFRALGYKYISTSYPQRFGKFNPTRFYYAMYVKI